MGNSMGGGGGGIFGGNKTCSEGIVPFDCASNCWPFNWQFSRERNANNNNNIGGGGRGIGEKIVDKLLKE
jgi:hypothetical protein